MLASLLSLAQVQAQADVRVNESGQIEARGTDLRVYRGAATAALFGEVTHRDDTACFAPALPLVAGETYRVEFQDADGRWSTQRVRFDLPPGEAPTASLAPTPAVLPANALKLYLHFSLPMEQGVFLERLALRRQDGSVIAGAFRETELWSPDGKRLTLWLHPGRQKTGVNLNTDEGPVLEAGRAYTLVLDRRWRSAEGVPLGRDLTFAITAVAADHTCPDPGRWQLTPPRAGTRDPLRLALNEPLDPALLRTALAVSRGRGRCPGTVRVAPDARAWAFTPDEPWQPGPHEIEPDPLLEDLAGNNLQHPFEVELTSDPNPPPPPAPVPVPPLHFEVREE